MALLYVVLEQISVIKESIGPWHITQFRNHTTTMNRLSETFLTQCEVAKCYKRGYEFEQASPKGTQNF